MGGVDPMVRYFIRLDAGDYRLPTGTIIDFLGRFDRFVDELRDQRIHVGVNNVCATCRKAWPCAVVAGSAPAADAEAAMAAALERCVELGWMAPAGVDDGGAQLYRLTATGAAHVEAMGGE